jgi:hypothetical protein
LAAKRVFPEVMQHYRRHSSNTSAWIASRTDKLNQAALFREYRNKDPLPFCLHRLKQLHVVEKRLQLKCAPILNTHPFDNRLNYAYKSLRLERRAVEARLQVLTMPFWRRLLPVLICWRTGQYRFFSGWKSAAKDLINK